MGLSCAWGGCWREHAPRRTEGVQRCACRAQSTRTGTAAALADWGRHVKVMKLLEACCSRSRAQEVPNSRTVFSRIRRWQASMIPACGRKSMSGMLAVCALAFTALDFNHVAAAESCTCVAHTYSARLQSPL